ncbi:MAG: hypothetical protein HOG05_05235 [Bacteroidetes bacterium]|nr:hypothetical protein [Bacteroidota bacterium]
MKINVQTSVHKIVILFILSVMSFGLLAQSIPKGFNYQAVARDNDGRAIVNKNLVVEVSIRSGSASGIIEWQEGHNVRTNDYGLFNLIIGNGVTTGSGLLSSFKNIPWGSNSYFLEVRVDFGNGLINMGTTKFLSVPYALFADSVKNYPQPSVLSLDTLKALEIQANSLKLKTGAANGAVLISDSFGNSSWQIAGGDVNGNYANLTVVGIQGNPVSAGVPINGQILKWNSLSSSWEIASDNVGITSISGGAGITVSGTNIDADSNKAIWNANQLQGSMLTNIAPSADGQVLKWNTLTSTWELGVDNNTATIYNAGSGMTLNGSTFNADSNRALWNANQLYGTAITSTLAPADGEILKWNGTSNQWEAATDGGNTYTSGTGITITGTTIDANASTSMWNANQISGTAVAGSISPADGEILKWNGTSNQWEVAADAGTTYTGGSGIDITGTTIDADTAAPKWNANLLYGTAISNTLTPASGDVLKYIGTEWVASTDNVNAYVGGTGITLTGLTIDADNETALWNARKLQSVSISSATPGNNQVLLFDSTAGVWKPATFAVTGATTFVSGAGMNISQTGSTVTFTNTGDTNSTDDITNSTAAGGDLSGTYPNPSVIGLQGQTLTATAPSIDGQILKWNNITSTWELGVDNNTGTTYTAGNGIDITGTTVSTVISSNSGLAFNAAELEVNPGTGLSLSGGLLNAQTTIAQWNANQLYGTAVSSGLAPSADQVLTWNGTSSQWEAATASGATYSAGAGMTLTGTTFDADSNRAIWNANQLYGTAVSNTLSPAAGQVLTWNGISNQWEATTASGATYSAGSGMTLNGTTFDADSNRAIWNANQLYGTAVSNTLSPAAGQVLTWNGTSSQWEATTASGSTYTAGSGMTLNGTIFDADSNRAIWNANQLYGTAVSNALSPTAGQILTWNGTSSQWEAATASGSTYLAGSGMTLTGNTFHADSNRAIWNANSLYGTSIDPSLTPSDGQVLKWSNTNSRWEATADAVNTYTAGNGINISGTTIATALSSNSGLAYNAGELEVNPGTGLTLSGGLLNAQTTIAQWNANQIYGTAVSNSLTPTNGDILKWNGTNSQWEIGTDNTAANFYTAGTGLTLTGSKFDADSNKHIWNADRLYDKLLPTSAPGNNQLLKYNGTSGEWAYVDESSYLYTAGNGISITSNTVATALSSNSGLAFNSGELEVNPGTGLTLSGGLLNAQTTIAQWNANKLQGVDVNNTAPTDKQVLMYDNGTSKWVASALPELQDADGDTKIHVEKTADEDKIRFDVAGTEEAIIDANGLGIGTSTPSSTLDVSGSYGLKLDTISNLASFTITLTANHNILIANNSSLIQNLLVNLPAAASCKGRIYTVKSINSGIVIVNPNGAETIDGASTKNLANPYDYVRFVSDGSNWFVIGNN